MILEDMFKKIEEAFRLKKREAAHMIETSSRLRKGKESLENEIAALQERKIAIKEELERSNVLLAKNERMEIDRQSQMAEEQEKLNKRFLAVNKCEKQLESQLSELYAVKQDLDKYHRELKEREAVCDRAFIELNDKANMIEKAENDLNLKNYDNEKLQNKLDDLITDNLDKGEEIKGLLAEAGGKKKEAVDILNINLKEKSRVNEASLSILRVEKSQAAAWNKINEAEERMRIQQKEIENQKALLRTEQEENDRMRRELLAREARLK